MHGTDDCLEKNSSSNQTDGDSGQHTSGKQTPNNPAPPTTFMEKLKAGLQKAGACTKMEVVGGVGVVGASARNGGNAILAWLSSCCGGRVFFSCRSSVREAVTGGGARFLLLGIWLCRWRWLRQRSRGASGRRSSLSPDHVLRRWLQR